MSDATIPPPVTEAAAVLPPGSGSNARMSVGLWEDGYKARARSWTTPDGRLIVDLQVGNFGLSATPEQWEAIKQLMDAVLPVQVSA